jgi:hypothetical protein
MQKALLIGAFMFAYSLPASPRELTLSHMPSAGVDAQSAVVHRQRTADTSVGAEKSPVDSDRWLDKTLDRKLLICRGC